MTYTDEYAKERHETWSLLFCDPLPEEEADKLADDVVAMERELDQRRHQVMVLQLLEEECGGDVGEHIDKLRAEQRKECGTGILLPGAGCVRPRGHEGEHVSLHTVDQLRRQLAEAQEPPPDTGCATLREAYDDLTTLHADLKRQLAAAQAREAAWGRFFAKIDDDDGACWAWGGAQTGNDYPRFWFEGRMWLAHRWIVTQLHGEIPDGMQVDHLCKTRLCVNPSHLEVVTAKENTARSYRPQRRIVFELGRADKEGRRPVRLMCGHEAFTSARLKTRCTECRGEQDGV